MKIALVTTDEDSTIAGMADVVVVMPGVSPKWKERATALLPFSPWPLRLNNVLFDV